MCEPILLNEVDNNFIGLVIRLQLYVALVKMRFDLSVNILTNFAYHKRFINVFGENNLGQIFI